MAESSGSGRPSRGGKTTLKVASAHAGPAGRAVPDDAPVPVSPGAVRRFAPAEPVAESLRMQRPRPVNRIFYWFASTIFRRLILGIFRLQPVNVDVVPRGGSAIILSNHTSLFDPIWLYAMLRRPVHFAATEDLFRQPFLARLIRWFGAFPKRKNTPSDVGALRTIFALIKSDCLVGIYPEGVRTWDGTTGPIIPAIARLIRKLRVPVYTCRAVGAYFAIPRWARYWRRIAVRGEFAKLYEPGEIPEDERRILEDIAAAIRTPDYDLEIDMSGARQRGLAVNVTKVLYRCPNCGTMEGLKLVRPFSTNRVECSSCFSSWIIDARCRLAALDENGLAEEPWTPLPQLYARIRGLPLSPINTTLRLGLQPGEQLFLASRPRFLFKQEQFPNLKILAFGRLFLTDRRLIFRTRLGIPLAAPLAAIGAHSVDPGDKLHFTFEGKVFRLAFRNESPLKWFDTIQRLEQASQEEAPARLERPR